MTTHVLINTNNIYKFYYAKIDRNIGEKNRLICLCLNESTNSVELKIMILSKQYFVKIMYI